MELDIKPRASGIPILSKSTFEEAGKSRDTIRTCLVNSTYDSTGTVSLDGDPGFNTMSIKKSQEGFTLGEGRRDENGHVCVKFNLARTERSGWVPRECLTLGQTTTHVKIIGIGDDLAGSAQLPGSENGGTRLEKTICALYSTIRTDKDDLLEQGAELDGLNDVCENGNQYRLDIVKCRLMDPRELLETNRVCNRYAKTPQRNPRKRPIFI